MDLSIDQDEYTALKELTESCGPGIPDIPSPPPDLSSSASTPTPTASPEQPSSGYGNQFYQTADGSETGYIGQHCGAELLRQGYEVVGTIRSMEKAEAVREGIAKVAPIDNLTFVEADLTSDEGWLEAMAGCKYVLHVASPFIIADPEDENEMISPAVDGTLRVLSAAKAVGVERTVVTSSLIAIIAGKLSGHYGTDSWSDPNEEIGTYAKSKTLAEQAAWEFAEANDIDLVVINPGGVMGPTLTGKVEGESLTMISDIISGKYPLVPDICIGFIDVRDVAKLHVSAMTADGAVGKRFIASSDEPLHFKEVTGILKKCWL